MVDDYCAGRASEKASYRALARTRCAGHLDDELVWCLLNRYVYFACLAVSWAMWSGGDRKKKEGNHEEG